jgi:hypothetical protein
MAILKIGCKLVSGPMARSERYPQTLQDVSADLVSSAYSSLDMSHEGMDRSPPERAVSYCDSSEFEGQIELQTSWRQCGDCVVEERRSHNAHIRSIVGMVQNIESVQ